MINKVIGKLLRDCTALVLALHEDYQSGGMKVAESMPPKRRKLSRTNMKVLGSESKSEIAMAASLDIIVPCIGTEGLPTRCHAPLPLLADSVSQILHSWQCLRKEITGPFFPPVN